MKTVLSSFSKQLQTKILRTIPTARENSWNCCIYVFDVDSELSIFGQPEVANFFKKNIVWPSVSLSGNFNNEKWKKQLN